MEVDESPRPAVRREVLEDIELDLEPGPLLTVDSKPRDGDVTEVVALHFDDRILTAQDVDRIVTDPSEVRAHRFVELDEGRVFLDDELFARCHRSGSASRWPGRVSRTGLPGWRTRVSGVPFRSVVDPMAQVKHPLALDHDVRILQQMWRVDRPEVSASRTRARRVRHPSAPRRRDLRQTPGHRPRRRRSDHAVTRKLPAPWPLLPRRRRSGRASGSQPSGTARASDDHVIDAALLEASRPTRPSGRRRGGRRPSHRSGPCTAACSRRTPVTPATRRSVQRHVTVGQPVDERSGLVTLVSNEAVDRHRAVHDHLATDSPLLGMLVHISDAVRPSRQIILIGCRGRRSGRHRRTVPWPWA